MEARYIIYQAYGNQAILAECLYALVRLHGLMPHATPVIYTDNVTYFNPVGQWFSRYEIVPITQSMIEEWRGGIQFVHRVKIKVIQHFFMHHQGAAIYCDTDTVCLRHCALMFDAIANGKIFMHEDEGKLADKQNLFKKWRRFLGSAPAKLIFQQDDITATHMWNAGVIGMDASHAHLLNEVLSLTDMLYPHFPKHTVEQFAFSYVFQQCTKIESAQQYFFHYWGLKTYRLLLQKYFASTPAPVALQYLQTHQFTPMAASQEQRASKAKPWYRKLLVKKWSLASRQL
jgi:hypothetical protein